MDVTFGAVGDFIAVGLLIKDLFELLDDTRGSAWDYQALVAQLGDLRRMIERAEAFCQQHGEDSDLADICSDLNDVAGRAKRRLEGVARKVQKYGKSLAPDAPSRVIRDTARKLQFRLERNEIEKFRDDLMRYVGSIDSLLMTAAARSLQKLHNNHDLMQQLIRRCEEQTAHRLTNIENQLTVIQSQSSSVQDYLAGLAWLITGGLGSIAHLVTQLNLDVRRGNRVIVSFGSFVWGTLLSVQSRLNQPEQPLSIGLYFTFEDFTGRESVLTLEYINSWEVFDMSLLTRFKTEKGGRRVARRRFLLQDSSSGLAIDRAKGWGQAITPYSRIKMSLICRQFLDEEEFVETALSRCPFCKTECGGQAQKSIQCKGCTQLFGVINSESDRRLGCQNSRQRCEGESSQQWDRAPATRAETSDSDESDTEGLKNVAIQRMKNVPIKRDSTSERIQPAGTGGSLLHAVPPLPLSLLIKQLPSFLVNFPPEDDPAQYFDFSAYERSTLEAMSDSSEDFIHNWNSLTNSV